jgi:hypothetical protein
MKYFLTGIFGFVFSLSVHTQTLIDFSSIPTSGTVLINAHMDDDLIWMLPFWNITNKFVGGAMPSTTDFNSIIHEQQIYLNNNGYNIDYESNWHNPWGSITDSEYAGYYWNRDPTYNYLASDFLLKDWDDNDPLVVRTEINRIKAKVEKFIASAEVSRIITHNNWGEYGHQHHKAINKAVRELAVKYRKDVWMLGCTANVNTDGSFNDITIPSGITYTIGSFNPGLYSAIKEIYSNYWHWTGSSAYTPDGNHPFIKIVEEGNDMSNSLPTSLIPNETISLPGAYQNRPGAYIFDGIDDYMTLSCNQNSSFSISMWIRPEELKLMDISRMTEYPSSGTYDRSLYLNPNGTVTAHINDGTSKTITSTISITAGNWTHIAMTSDGTNLKIYINGVGNAVSAGLSAITFTRPEFVLGQAKETSSFFNGQIDEVHLFDYPLTEADVLNLSGTSSPETFYIKSITGIGGTITPLGERVVLQGTNLTYNITPDQYYTIKEVIVDGVNQGSVSSYTLNNITNNHTILATFSSHLGNIALNKPTTCQSYVEPNWPSSKANDEDGSNESLWAANGSNPQWWKVDLGSVYNITHVVIRNKTNSGVLNGRYYHYIIQASMDDIIYTPIAEKNNANISTDSGDYYDLSTTARYLKVNILFCSDGNGAAISDFRAYGTINNNFSKIYSSAGTWGTISPLGELDIQKGTNKTFIITPDFGYQISDVKVDNISIGAVSSYTFEGISEDHTIIAEFSSTMQNVALNKNTTSQSSIDLYWDSHKANDEDGSNNSCWAAEPFPQWWEVDLGGTYNISYIVIRNYFQGSRYYHYNVQASTDQITYTTIAEKTNDNFATDKGDIYILSTTTRYLKVNMISCSDGNGVQISDFRAYGTLVPTTYTFSANAGLGGTVTPSGTFTVNPGTNHTFTFTPTSGYQVGNVTIDGTSIGKVSSFTFNNVTANHTVEVEFSILTPTNVALNKPTTCQSFIVGNESSKANDPDVSNNSYWAAKPYPRWWKVDLGALYNLSSINIRNFVAGSRYYQYNIQGSSDDVTYSRIVSKVNRNIATTNGDTYPISATVRYLKVNMTYSSANMIVQISDFKAYGTPTSGLPSYSITSSSGSNGTINPSGTVTVSQSTNYTYNIIANSGYQVANVLVDGLSVGPVTSYTFNNISTNHTILATFSDLSTFTITSSAGTGGIIAPSGETTVNPGASQTYNIYPGDGYEISDVTIDGGSVGTVSTYTFNNIGGNHTIAATFIPFHIITARAGENGTITPMDEVIVPQNGSRIFTITPDAGFKIGEILVDGLPIENPSSTYTFSNVIADHTINVFFEPVFIITARAGENGTISPVDEVIVPQNGSQMFTITPDLGFQIGEVLVDGLPIDNPFSTYTFTNVTADHTINAFFVPVFILTARAGENGTITPMDEVIVPLNGSQMFTIIPDAGFQIGEVLVDGLPIANPSSTYTFANVMTDHTINAFFQESGSKGNPIDSPSLKLDSKTEDIQIETVLSFYPNPFKDKFTIRIDTPNDEMFDISVISLNGSKVYLNTRIEGNTDNIFNLQLTQGIYILKARDKKRTMIQRIVKY